MAGFHAPVKIDHDLAKNELENSSRLVFTISRRWAVVCQPAIHGTRFAFIPIEDDFRGGHFTAYIHGSVHVLTFLRRFRNARVRVRQTGILVGRHRGCRLESR